MSEQFDVEKLKILCLNGGGARGLFTINVLAEIERIIEQKTGDTSVNVGDYFDLITGTSIGGFWLWVLLQGKQHGSLRPYSESRLR